MTTFHEPVLVNEVVQYLNVSELAHSKRKVTFVDATVGFGGHAKEFVKRGVFVLGIDTDETTLKHAKEVLNRSIQGPSACPGVKSIDDFFKLIHSNFRQIDTVVQEEKLVNVFGILIDLGVSTPQLTSETRGLSFGNPNAELDMRLDTNSLQVRASDLLNVLNEKQLFEMFKEIMNYKDAKELTRNVVLARKEKEFKTVGDFLNVISRPDRWNGGEDRTNPATLPFMALRIAVNSELENLKEVLPRAFGILESGGRLAVISFHSGEDRIVKNFYSTVVQDGKGTIVTKKPVVPDEIELKKNPRARSAKLRVIEKI